MKVYWQYSDKAPQCGDLKIMKDGRKFICSGMYVVSNGENCYEWFNYDDDAVKHHRERIEKGEIKFCKNHSKG